MLAVRRQAVAFQRRCAGPNRQRFGVLGRCLQFLHRISILHRVVSGSVAPIDVAEYILRLRERDGHPTTPMEINKLVFLIHGWMLGDTGEKLIDEKVEAWPYGPVIPSLYHQYKKFGKNPIKAEPGQSAGDASNMTEDQKKSISKAEKHYRKFGAWQLAKLTHVKGSPWSTARAMGNFVISHRRIRRYYRNLIRRIEERYEEKKAEFVGI